MSNRVEGTVIAVRASRSKPNMDTIEIKYKLSGTERTTFFHVAPGTCRVNDHVVMDYDRLSDTPFSLM